MQTQTVELSKMVDEVVLGMVRKSLQKLSAPGGATIRIGNISGVQTGNGKTADKGLTREGTPRQRAPRRTKAELEAAYEKAFAMSKRQYPDWKKRRLEARARSLVRRYKV